MKIELTNGAIGAQIRAASFDDKDHSISLIWSTGAPVRRRGPQGYFLELLDMSPASVDLSRLNKGAPLLDSHRDDNLSRVIGSVVPGSAKIAGGKGVARVILSRAAGDADNIQKIKDGVVRNISIGYTIEKVEIVERENDIPVYRVVAWTPVEISAVPIPADSGAGIVQARSKAARSSSASVTILPRYSVAACRARMMAKNMQRGITTHNGSTQH